MLIIKIRSNEKRRNNNKDDFKRSKTVPSSAAILIARYIYTVQVINIYIPPAPPSHSASYNITSNHHHYHHHAHHGTNYNASIQYTCHCLRKNTTTTAITQCKLQYYGQPPLPPPPPPQPPQHKLQCMHSVYAPLL